MPCSVPYFTSTLRPAGSHPHLHISVPPNLPPSQCPLYLHLPIPPHFIADRHQLQQLHDEGRLGAPAPSTSTSASAASASGASELTFLATGEGDLELPVSRAGTGDILIRLREPNARWNGKGKGKAEEEVREWEVPLHLRYLEPVAERFGAGGARQDLVNVTLEWPSLFWACGVEDLTPPLLACLPNTLPPDVAPHLAHVYRLYYLSPSPDNLPTLRPSICPPPAPPPHSLAIPTGVMADLPWVEATTVVTIWLGMLWLGWKVWGLSRRLSRKTLKVE